MAEILKAIPARYQQPIHRIEHERCPRKKPNTALLAIGKLVASFQDRAQQELRESDVIYTNAWRICTRRVASDWRLDFLLPTPFLDRLPLRSNEFARITNSMSNGDLTSRIHLSQTDEVGQLASATDMLADSLSDMVAKIQSTSTTLGVSSSHVGTDLPRIVRTKRRYIHAR